MGIKFYTTLYGRFKIVEGGFRSGYEAEFRRRQRDKIEDAENKERWSSNFFFFSICSS